MSNKTCASWATKATVSAAATVATAVKKRARVPHAFAFTSRSECARLLVAADRRRNGCQLILQLCRCRWRIAPPLCGLCERRAKSASKYNSRRRRRMQSPACCAFGASLAAAVFSSIASIIFKVVDSLSKGHRQRYCTTKECKRSIKQAQQHFCKKS